MSKKFEKRNVALDTIFQYIVNIPEELALKYEKIHPFFTVDYEKMPKELYSSYISDIVNICEKDNSYLNGQLKKCFGLIFPSETVSSIFNIGVLMRFFILFDYGKRDNIECLKIDIYSSFFELCGLCELMDF